eukprot:4233288-Prymnesium_polylepis.1
MAAGVTFAEQLSESGEMGSCARLPRCSLTRRASWASWSPSIPRSLSPLSESGELVTSWSQSQLPSRWRRRRVGR